MRVWVGVWTYVRGGVHACAWSVERSQLPGCVAGMQAQPLKLITVCSPGCVTRVGCVLCAGLPKLGLRLLTADYPSPPRVAPDLWAPGRSVQGRRVPSDGPKLQVGSLDASIPSWVLQRASWPKCSHLLGTWVYMGNPRGMSYTFSFYCWGASGKDWIRDRGWERQRSTFVAQPY